MTTYYVGPGGNDANDGLTYANRKLTLNGAEDVPVVAGDVIHVAPGVYPETLTCDVDGALGSLISYYGDVTGVNTDGIGGPVIITGSDDGETPTRLYGVDCANKDYRYFSGFHIDMVTEGIFDFNTGTVVENCTFANCSGNGLYTDNTALDTIVRQCDFLDCLVGITYNVFAPVANSNALIQNCAFHGGADKAIAIRGHQGVKVVNCTISSHQEGIDNLGSGATVSVYDCIITNCSATALDAVTVEDYNSLSQNVADRAGGTPVGANSDAIRPRFKPFVLTSARIAAPLHHIFELSDDSALRAIAGSANEATVDFYGRTRPAAGKRSRGAFQHQNVSQDSSVSLSGTFSIKLTDYGRHQFFAKMTAGKSITVSVYVCWDSDYAGDLPRLIIGQPGQSDVVAVATGDGTDWLKITASLTSAILNYGYVILESRNTASAGDYDVLFDNLAVSEL